MKQTVTIMAMCMVVLLLMSGFIVAGSLQQSQQLDTRATQLGEMRDRLGKQQTKGDELQTNVDELSLTLMQTAKERDALRGQLKDALLSIEEANGAVSQQVLDMEASQTAFSDKNDELSTELEEQQALNKTLMAELERITAEHDQAVTHMGELEDELVALGDLSAADALESELQLQQAMDRIDQLLSEADSFHALLAQWNDLRLGIGDSVALEEANTTFLKNYPDSVFALPKKGMNAQTPEATVMPAPLFPVEVTPTPVLGIWPARTFIPIVTFAPTSSPATIP